MLQQQVNDRDERIQDLESLVYYYEGDVTTMSLHVSRTGARYHLSRDCRSLTCCSQCIQVLRDNSNLVGRGEFLLDLLPV